MKQNYQILIRSFMLVSFVVMMQAAFGNVVNIANSTMSNPVLHDAGAFAFNGCSGTGTAASDGSFSTGYSYTFSTTGTTVNVTATLLDTNKVGVVAYTFKQDPFGETAMANTSGLTFSCSLPSQTLGQTIGLAIKFAYAGGQVVTQYINYTVGSNCTADTQAPTAFTAVLGTVTQGSAQLLLNATDDSGSVTYAITYGSTTVTATGASGVQKSVIITGLTPETTYSFSITAKDAANNVAANSPLTIPATTLEDTNTACSGTSTQAQGVVQFTTGYTYNFTTSGNNVTATFTLQDTDKPGVVAYLWKTPGFQEIGMAPSGGNTFTATAGNLIPGNSYNFAVKFAYAGGQIETKYFTYTVGDTCAPPVVDTQAPTAFTATAGTLTPTSVELLLNATDDSGSVTYTITYGSTTVTATGASGVQKSVIITGLTPETTYSFSITAKDAANNVAANSPLTIPATTLEDTNTACSGTSTQAQGVVQFTTGYTYNFTTSGNTVTATFTLLDTDKPGAVAYLWKTPDFQETAMTPSSGNTFTATVGNLTPGNSYNFAVKFAYAGGGQIETKYFTYTVGDTCAPPVVDTQAPTAFTATAGTLTSTSVELLLNASDDSGSVTYTITYGSTTVTATGASGVQKSVIITGLTPETTYSFSITAKDAANNVAANSPLTIPATTLEDTNTACSGTSTQAQGVVQFTNGYTYNFTTSGNTVTAAFTLLDTDKPGAVAYLWKTPDFQETAMTPSSGNTFTATVGNLTPGNSYNFAVKFAYAGGGQIETKYFTYTVGDACEPTIIDTEAPAQFTASVGAVTSTSVELLLNATDDSGEVVYNVTYGATTIAVAGLSGEQVSRVITPLFPGTAYTFSIAASDNSGNQAPNNAIVLAATTAAHNNTPCSGISAEAGQGSFSTGYSYNFTTSGTDVTMAFTLLDTDKTDVLAYLWQQNPHTETAMVHLSGHTYSATITGQVPGMTITYAVKFAFAGGLSATKYFSYIVGDDCSGELFTTVWDDGAWSNGIPVSYQYNAVIADDYDSAANGEITAGALSVTHGNAIISEGDNFMIEGLVEVSEGATLTLEHNAGLIQVSNVQNSGNIAVIKDSAPMYRLDYALWGSPVAGQVLQEFSEQTLSNRFYTYNAVNDSYNAVAEPQNTGFETGKGYLIRVANTHPAYVSNDVAPVRWTGTFTGIPNNGDIDVAVVPAFDGMGEDNDIAGFNAVANPYPSAINIAAFFEENQGNLASNTPIFFWRKKNGAETSSYCSLTLAGYNANSGNDFGDSSNGVFSDANDSGNWVINSGQGFIVRAVAGTVSFKNSMRSTTSNGQMFRNGMDIVTEKSRLWLNLTNAGGLFAQATIAYTPHTTNALDYGWDGGVIIDGDIALYTVAEGSQLAIQARAAFNAADEVPVHYKVTTAGEYTIAIDHHDGLFAEGQSVYLRDNVLGITHNLQNPYTFTTDAGSVQGRFDVVYADALSAATPDFDNSIIAYTKDNTINVSTGNAGIKSISVYDVHGRLLYSAAGINAPSFSVTTLQAASQMLVVQVETAQGFKACRKIVF